MFSARNGKEVPLERLPSIQEFYKDKSVLLVGKTGFLGKLMIIKLLKSCPDIKRIYFLYFEKDYITEAQEKVFRDDPIFKEANVNLAKVDFHNSYFTNLNVNEVDQHVDSKIINALKNEISVIFYIFGTSYLDMRILPALDKNYFKLQSFVEQLEFISGLKSFVYVSTALSHSEIKKVPEDICSGADAIFPEVIRSAELLPEDYCARATSIAPYKQVSVYTKILAEKYLVSKAETFPIGIFRPGMLTATIDEPKPGYIENFNYANGIVLLSLYGYLGKVTGDRKSSVNIVPVDLAVNALIVSACDVAIRNLTRKRPVFYNFVSTEGPRSITWKQFQNYLSDELENSQKDLSDLWCKLRIVKNKYCVWGHNIVRFYPYIDAYLSATLHKNRKRNRKALESAQNMEKFISYVSKTSWEYDVDNVCSMWDRLSEEDRVTFNFVKFLEDFKYRGDAKMSKNKPRLWLKYTGVNPWPGYFKTYVRSVREFALKKDPDCFEYLKELSRYRFFFTIIRILIISCLLCMLIIYFQLIPKFIVHFFTFEKL